MTINSISILLPATVPLDVADQIADELDDLFQVYPDVSMGDTDAPCIDVAPWGPESTAIERNIYTFVIHAINAEAAP